MVQTSRNSFGSCTVWYSGGRLECRLYLGGTHSRQTTLCRQDGTRSAHHDSRNAGTSSLFQHVRLFRVWNEEGYIQGTLVAFTKSKTTRQASPKVRRKNAPDGHGANRKNASLGSSATCHRAECSEPSILSDGSCGTGESGGTWGNPQNGWSQRTLS